MLQSKARWQVSEFDPNIVSSFVTQLNLDPMVAQLLAVRGISDVLEAEAFMQGGHELFHDPFLLDGMMPAVARIRLAIDNKQKIRIYGDYDADGVCSTSLMALLLKKLDADFDYYIPHRANEGYGLNNSALDHALREHVALIITVDNGISAFDEIRYANELGIDVIVTDHHEPPSLLPEAIAIIHPKKPGCSYPFPYLAGVGVAFKLAQAMLDEFPEGLLELAAIGTVADLMPLRGENRLLVKLGLRKMRKSPSAGIKAICEIAGTDSKELSATQIGFSIAPRINAAGRLASADNAVLLLTTVSEQEAEHFARELDQLNQERQKIVELITQQAIEQMEQMYQMKEMDSVILLAKADWNIGVVGIVAAKIVERYHRPAIILCIDTATGICKGSARSIPGFDLYKALNDCSDLLDHFGGHQAAAGMTLNERNIVPFRNRLIALGNQWLSNEDFIPVLKADFACELHQVSLAVIEQIQLLAPFGMGNPVPKFIVANLSLQEKRLIGKDQQHLKMTVHCDSNAGVYSMEAIGFGKGALSEWISPTAKIDIVGEVSINEWNGSKRPQLLIQDIRVTERQVYDWRGTHSPEQRLAGLFDRLKPARGFAAVPAILFCSHEEAMSLPKLAESSECAVWVYSENGMLEPANGIALQLPFDTVKDVVFYSLPGSIHMFQSFINKCDHVQRFYVLFADCFQEESAPLPSREMFRKLYSYLLHDGEAAAERTQMIQSLSKRTGFSIPLVQFMLKVFEQLSFIQRTETGVRCLPNPEKQDLMNSYLYRKRMNRDDVEQRMIYSTSEQLSKLIIRMEEQVI